GGNDLIASSEPIYLFRASRVRRRHCERRRPGLGGAVALSHPRAQCAPAVFPWGGGAATVPPRRCRAGRRAPRERATSTRRGDGARRGWAAGGAIGWPREARPPGVLHLARGPAGS